MKETKNKELPLSDSESLIFLILFQIQNTSLHGSQLYDVVCEILDHIPDSPFITLEEFEAHIDTICHNGYLNYQVANFMKTEGFMGVH